MTVLWSEFLKQRRRIEAFAWYRGQRSREQIARNGHDLGELHPHALVNHVWRQILEDKISWDPAQASLYHFFCQEIHNRVRSFEQRKRGPHLHIVDSDPVSGWEISADRLSDDGRGVREIMESLDRARLRAHVESFSAKLALLAILILDGFTPGEQAELLDISPATRLRWQNKLEDIVLKYLDEDESGAKLR